MHHDLKQVYRKRFNINLYFKYFKIFFSLLFFHCQEQVQYTALNFYLHDKIDFLDKKISIFDAQSD